MQWFKRKTRVTVSPTEPILPTEYQSPPSPIEIPSTTHETIIPKKNCCQQCCTKENLKEQALLLATIVSVILGVIVGIALREIKCSSSTNSVR